MKDLVSFSAFSFVCAALLFSMLGGSVTVSAQTVLYQFGSTPHDGFDPSSLIQASDGKLYGATGSGGTAGFGTIFSLTPSGAYQQIYSFQGAADGAGPQTPLVQAQDGYLYGITRVSTSAISYEIFRIWPGGSTVQVVYTFPPTTQICSSLVPDRLGNLYGETPNDGANSAGTIFRYNLTAGYKLLHSFVPPEKGICGSPVVASDALLYGAATTGLWQMAKSGGDYNLFHEFSSEPFPPHSPAGGLTEASDGNIYGAAGGGRLNYGVLYQILPGSLPTASTLLFFGDRGPNFFLGGTFGANDIGNLYTSQFLQDDASASTLAQIDLAVPSYAALGSRFGYNDQLTAQPLLAGDGNLYATTYNSQGGSIVTYPLSNGPVAEISAAKNAVMQGDTVWLTFSVNNAFSNSMKQCFVSDNIPGHLIRQVGPTGVIPWKTTTAGTITYGIECGGVESATTVVTVTDCDQ